jgi:chemotaxis protein MotA
VVEDRAEESARVFEAAGGYAPTIGIIGAVLGLIQVMKHLDAVSEIGKGIAVAFVATVYGVASANLLLLPAASKLRFRARREIQTQELMVEGVLAIAEGLNPQLIRMRLETFLEEKVVTANGISPAAKPQTAEGRTAL